MNKGKRYSSDFKAKVVVELLEGDLTLNQICSKYKLTQKSVKQWKVKFLNNASLVFNVDGEVKEYKGELTTKDKEIDNLHRQLGKSTAEVDFLTKKLKSLVCCNDKSLLEPKHSQIPLYRQCELLSYNRSSYYYTPSVKDDKEAIVRVINRIYSSYPFFGYRKIHNILVEQGHKVGKERVLSYMQELGLKAIYPERKICTTVPIQEHKKYPYLLRDLDVCYPNQVWSTDITYR